MRILNSPAAWGLTIAAVFVYFLYVATAPAQASRPIAGYDYPDLCKNRGAYAMPGVQGAYLFPMHLRFVHPDAEPNRLGRKACVSARMR